VTHRDLLSQNSYRWLNAFAWPPDWPNAGILSVFPLVYFYFLRNVDDLKLNEEGSSFFDFASMGENRQRSRQCCQQEAWLKNWKPLCLTYRTRAAVYY